MSEHGEAPLPSQIAPWSPQHTGRGTIASTLCQCLKSTVPGDRIAIYETRDGEGVVGFVDSATHAFPAEGMGWACWGKVTWLPAGGTVLLARLKQIPVLAPTFNSRQSRCSISREQAFAIAAELDGLPPAATATPEEAAPYIDPDDPIVWLPEGPKSRWGNEAQLRDCLAASAACRKLLGLPKKPLVERGGLAIGDSTRTDIRSANVIVECKLHAGPDAFMQLEGYLTRHAESTGRNALGHIVAGETYGPALVDAVMASQGRIRLWIAEPHPEQGDPALAEVRNRSDGWNSLANRVMAHRAQRPRLLQRLARLWRAE